MNQSNIPWQVNAPIVTLIGSAIMVALAHPFSAIQKKKKKIVTFLNLRRSTKAMFSHFSKKKKKMFIV